MVWLPHSGHRRGSSSSGNLVTPGSILFSASGSAIKRITGWREGLAADRLCKFSISWTGLHPPAKSAFERKKNTASAGRAATLLAPLAHHIGRYKPTIRSEARTNATGGGVSRGPIPLRRKCRQRALLKSIRRRIARPKRTAECANVCPDREIMDEV